MFLRKGPHLWGIYCTGLLGKPEDFVANSDFTPLGVPGVQFPHQTELGKVSVNVTVFEKPEGVCTARSAPSQVLRLVTDPAASPLLSWESRLYWGSDRRSGQLVLRKTTVSLRNSLHS